MVVHRPCGGVSGLGWVALRSGGAGGVQEVAVTVKGGYTPDVIVVKAGQPVRLRFTRQESASCSETVLFPDFNRNAKLPEGEEVCRVHTGQAGRGWLPMPDGDVTRQADHRVVIGHLTHANSRELARVPEGQICYHDI